MSEAPGDISTFRKYCKSFYYLWRSMSSSAHYPLKPVVCTGCWTGLFFRCMPLWSCWLCFWLDSSCAWNFAGWAFTHSYGTRGPWWRYLTSHQTRPALCVCRLLVGRIVLQLVTALSCFSFPLQTCVLLLQFVEAIVVLIRQTSHMRVTRALRPIFLVDCRYCGAVRRLVFIKILSVFSLRGGTKSLFYKS